MLDDSVMANTHLKDDELHGADGFKVAQQCTIADAAHEPHGAALTVLHGTVHMKHGSELHGEKVQGEPTQQCVAGVGVVHKQHGDLLHGEQQGELQDVHALHAEQGQMLGVHALHATMPHVLQGIHGEDLTPQYKLMAVGSEPDQHDAPLEVSAVSRHTRDASMDLTFPTRPGNGELTVDVLKPGEDSRPHAWWIRPARSRTRSAAGFF